MLRTPQPGETIGPYRVERVLGRGGQGVVLEAVSGIGRRVALKLLLEADSSSAARFRRETQLLHKLDHPNLVRVVDHGVVDDAPFVATELLAGKTLRALVDEGGPPDVAWTIDCMEGIAAAIDHCHARGVIHRDLKPENVLWVDERPVVIDFGLAQRDHYKLDGVSLEESLAQLTRTGEMLGTPGYMPPEQVDPSFGSIGPAADVYALGGVLYFLLTGRAPFSGGTAYNVIVAVMSKPPADPNELRPEADPALARLSLEALAKRPRDRPPSAAAFAQALRSDAQVGSARPRWAPLVLIALAGLGLTVWLTLRRPDPLAQGLALLEAKSFAEAEALLGPERDRRPEDPDVLEAYLRAVEGQGTRWEEVEATSTQLLAVAPEHPTALRRRAYARLRLGDRAGSLRDIEAFLRIHPESAAGLRTRGVLHTQATEHAEALACYLAAWRGFEAGIDRGRLSEAHLHHDVGQAHLNVKQPGPALEQAEAILALDSELVFGYRLKARALAAGGQVLEAVKFRDEVVRRRPNDAASWLARGQTWQQAAQQVEGLKMSRRYDRALEDFERAAGLASTKAERVRALMLAAGVARALAFLHRSRARLRQVLDRYRAIERLGPHADDVSEQLGKQVESLRQAIVHASKPATGWRP